MRNLSSKEYFVLDTDQRRINIDYDTSVSSYGEIDKSFTGWAIFYIINSVGDTESPFWRTLKESYRLHTRESL